MNRGCAGSVVVGVLVGALLGCDREGPIVDPGGEGPQPNPVRPRALLSLERGVISATGSASQDTLTFSANVDGHVRIVLGRDCGGETLFEERAVETGTEEVYTVSASDSLATEGEHAIHACFVDAVGQSTRSTVVLRVDNTPPRVIPTLSPGDYCERQFVGFYCTDCVSIAYGFSPDVGFDDDGNVTSGTRYKGLDVLVTGETTLYFRGVDRAGNVSAVESATYRTEAGEIAFVGASHDVISGNFSSTQPSSEVSLQGEPGTTFDIRRGASCALGVTVASGSLDDAGEGSAEVHATSLFVGENALQVCGTTPARCAVETSFSLSRKDNALGWTVEPAPGTADWSPCEAEMVFRFQDAEVSRDDGVIDLTYRLNQGGFSSPPFSVEDLEDGVRVRLDAGCFPEATRVDLGIVPTDYRDEAGNPLPQAATWVTTGTDQGWHPFGGKTYAVGDDETVTDEGTGLVWHRCDASRGPDCDGFSATQTWQNANAACMALGTAEVEGRRDWRLPTVRDLVSLLDHEAAGGDHTFLDAAFEGGTSPAYWTSTGTGQFGSPWTVDFETGALVQYSPSLGRAVRCVAGTGAPQERVYTLVSWTGTAFEDDFFGEVAHDSASGLYWERTPSTASHTAAEAETACDGEIQGLEGWRLPTRPHYLSMYRLEGTPRLGAAPFSVFTFSCYWMAPLGLGRCVEPNSANTYSGNSELVWCVHEGP
jgi:hypothetical protein